MTGRKKVGWVTGGFGDLRGELQFNGECAAICWKLTSRQALNYACDNAQAFNLFDWRKNRCGLLEPHGEVKGADMFG